MQFTNEPVIIRENKMYRIVHLWDKYFTEGKNIFGNWSQGGTIEEEELDSYWGHLEDLAAQYTK